MKRDIKALRSKTFDLLVIGAGVHGACVARDAALRGLRVAIIDKGDIGGATSHNSLKTIHGGIRYLQHFNFKRTLESIKEQKYWLETAPHLVKPIQFMMPTYGWGMRGPIAMYIGIRLYELLSMGRNRRLSKQSKLARGKILSKRECLEKAPDIPTSNLTGGAQWDEAQVEYADQAVMQVVQDAQHHQAVVANYVRASQFLLQENRVVGVEAVDELTRATFTIQADMVINAAGPWVIELLNQSEVKSLTGQVIPMSKSMNIVTRLPANSAAIGVQSSLESDSKIGSTKRLYFMVPWQGLTVIGTTHFAYPDEADKMQQEGDEIAAFIDEINHAYPSLQLTTDDVLYCYQGLGPADDDSGSKATQLHHSKVIDHSVEHKIHGLISIISVKWTTARLVAEKSVNLALRKLAPDAVKATSASNQDCVTRHQSIPDFPELHPRFSQLTDTELVAHCQRHLQQTMAHRLSDMLLRRTDDLVTNRLSIDQIKIVAKTMSNYFNWSQDEQTEQLKELTKIHLSDRIEQQLAENNFWDTAI